MRKTIILPVLLLAACTQQAPQQVTQPAQTEPTPATDAELPVTAPVSAAGFRAAGLRSPMPEGIELPFDFHRLNDNTVNAGAPNQERRIYVEIRQMTPQDAEAAVSGLLAQKGFSAPEVEVVKGVRELAFSRADGARVTVKINSRLPKPKAPDATCTLHMVWRST